MAGFMHMVDLALTDDEREEMNTGIPVDAPGPDYPYGLCICLTQPTIDKLGLDVKDCAVGDTIDMRALGEVTSISKSDGPMGPQCRIEIQLQKIAVEDEDEGDE